MEDEWELEGAFESAECGDEGEPPFGGRTIAWMSNADEIEGVGVFRSLLPPLPPPPPSAGPLPVLLLVLLLRPFGPSRLQLSASSLLSAIEISTWGVRKCIGGVALSTDRIESPESLNALTAFMAARAGSRLAGLCWSSARSSDEGVPGPGLSRSMPCRLKKCTRRDFIVPAR